MNAAAALPLDRPVPVDADAEVDWEALVRRHSGRVYGLAYRLSGNRADAEDITQEVFVRALRSSAAGRLREQGRTDGWWHRVTTNLFYDLARRRRRVVDLSGDVWEPADAAADPGAVTLLGRLDDDVEAALAALPVTYREAVLAVDVHGLTYAETAELLGAKPAAVRSRVHRGRRRLRTSLAHRAPTAGRARHGGPRDRA
jgi:RNA polymerase sigma factor (sigma-70 family)